jgi:co-chaperonin GroES (HSP10)
VNLRLLRDRVLISRFAYNHPLLAVVGVQLQKGRVVAVGPGRRVKRKVRFRLNDKDAQALYFEDGEETGKVRPVRVKVGDIVEFSPRNQVELNWEGEPYVMIWDSAIYGTTDESTSAALLWQQSAGHDRQGNYLSGRE